MIKFGNYKRIFGLLGKIAIIAIVFGSSFIFGSCEKYLDIENMYMTRPRSTLYFFPVPERKSISMEQLPCFPMNLN